MTIHPGSWKHPRNRTHEQSFPLHFHLFPESTPAHVDRLGASLKAMLDSRVALETNAANGPAPEGEGVGIRNASIAQQREAIGSERGAD